MKKSFCFGYFSMSQSESKFFHVWFEFFPSYLSRKKEISETFLSLGLWPWPQRFFPGFPFFYLGNLGTQIRRGKILLQTWRGKKSKRNTIETIFSYQYFLVFIIVSFLKKSHWIIPWVMFWMPSPDFFILYYSTRKLLHTALKKTLHHQ